MVRKLADTRNNKNIKSDFKKALDQMRAVAKKNNLTGMTLEEINNIISLARKEKGIKWRTKFLKL